MDWIKIIKSFREHNGLTQEKLADDLGVDPKTVRRWERGVSTPSVAYRARLARLMPSVHDVTFNEALIVLVDNCAKSALLFDGAYRIIRTSPHHQQMYAYTPEQLWGRSYYEIAPPDVAAYVAKIGGAEVIENDQTLVRKQIRAARPPAASMLDKGRMVYSRNDIYFIRENGVLMGVLVISTEITAKDYAAMPEGLF